MKAEPSQHLGAKAAIDLEREKMIVEVQSKIERLFLNKETINPLIIEEKLVFHLDVLNFLVNPDYGSSKDANSSKHNISHPYRSRILEERSILIQEKKLKRENNVAYLWQVSRSPAHWATLLSSFINEALANIYSKG